MKKSTFITFLFLCVFVCLKTANAVPWTYSYIGNPYDLIFDNDPPTGTYTDSNRITFKMILPDALNPIDTPGDLSPLYFSVSDGRFTLDSSSPDLYRQVIDVSATDSEGLPDDWHIELGALAFDDWPQVGEVRHVLGTTSTWDAAYRQEVTDYWPSTGGMILSADRAMVQGHPGGWSAAPVPESVTMLLLGAGLAGLAGFGRKRFKK